LRIPELKNVNKILANLNTTNKTPNLEFWKSNNFKQTSKFRRIPEHLTFLISFLQNLKKLESDNAKIGKERQVFLISRKFL